MKKILLLGFLALGILSCDKDDDNSTPPPLDLIFINQVNGENLQFGNSYTTGSSESYTVNELKYIISNIRLIKDDGTEFIYPVEESYFLIDHAQPLSWNIRLSGIDPGDYKKISFGFGVDPTKYPIESGSMNFVPTAEEADMLWSWSAGYKFIKLEGEFSTESNATLSPFLIHVGSHGANLDNYKEIELPLNYNTARSIIAAKTTPVPPREIYFDLSQIFDGDNIIRIEDKPDIQVDPVNAPKIATNISKAFSVVE